MGPMAGQHNRFVPPSGININQQLPPGFPGRFPQPMGAVRHVPRERETEQAPDSNYQGVSGVDDAMEIEESGVTDMPVDKHNKTTGVTAPADNQVRTSKPEEPVVQWSEAVSSSASIPEGTHPSSPLGADAACEPVGNNDDMDVSDGEGQLTSANLDPNPNQEDDQSTHSHEEELQYSAGGKDSDHPPTSASDYNEPREGPTEAIADTCSSEVLAQGEYSGH